MPSKADFEKVSQHFLQPLQRIFNKQLNEEMTDAFVEDLCQFSTTVLHDAHVLLRRKKYFPSIYEALAACGEATPQPKAAEGSSTPTKWPWQVRHENAVKLTQDYVSAFFDRKPSMVIQAAAAGKTGELRQYVEAIAWVQAQIICHVVNIGYDSGRIFGHGVQVSEQALYHFFCQQRDQAAIGHISVTMCTGRLRDIIGSQQMAA